MSTHEISWCDIDDLKSFKNKLDESSLNTFLLDVKSRKIAAELILNVASGLYDDVSLNIDEYFNTSDLENLFTELCSFPYNFSVDSPEFLASKSELAVLISLIFVERNHLESRDQFCKLILEKTYQILQKIHEIGDDYSHSSSKLSRMSTIFMNYSMVFAIFAIYSPKDLDLKINLQKITSRTFSDFFGFSKYFLFFEEVSIKNLKDAEICGKTKMLFFVIFSILEPFFNKNLGSVFPGFSHFLELYSEKISQKLTEILLKKLQLFNFNEIPVEIQNSGLFSANFLSATIYSSKIDFEVQNSSKKINEITNNFSKILTLLEPALFYEKIIEKLSHEEILSKMAILSLKISQLSQDFAKHLAHISIFLLKSDKFDEIAEISATIFSNFLRINLDKNKNLDNASNLENLRPIFEFLHEILSGPFNERFFNIFSSNCQIYQVFKKLIASSISFSPLLLKTLILGSQHAQFRDWSTLFIDFITINNSSSQSIESALIVLKSFTLLLKDSSISVYSHHNLELIRDIVNNALKTVIATIASPDKVYSRQKIEAVETYLGFLNALLVHMQKTEAGTGKQKLQYNQLPENPYQTAPQLVSLSIHQLVVDYLASITRSIAIHGSHLDCIIESVAAFVPFPTTLQENVPATSLYAYASGPKMIPSISCLSDLETVMDAFTFPTRFVSPFAAKNFFAAGIIYDSPFLFNFSAKFPDSLDALSKSNKFLLYTLSVSYLFSAKPSHLQQFLATITDLTLPENNFAKDLIYAPNLKINRFYASFDNSLLAIFNRYSDEQSRIAVLKLIKQYTKIHGDEFLRYLNCSDGKLMNAILM